MFGQGSKLLRERASSFTTVPILSQRECLEFRFDQTQSATCINFLPAFCNGKETLEVFEIAIVGGENPRTYHIYRSVKDVKKLYSKLKKDKEGKSLLPKRPKKVKDAEGRLAACNEVLSAIPNHPNLRSHPAFMEFVKPTSEDSMDKLTVKVLEGEKLPIADLNGLSDPYCKVCLYNDRKKKISIEQRTPVIKETLDPKWGNECTYTFVIGNDVAGISVSCWDWDRVSRNDMLGRINVRLDTIPYNTDCEWWFPLHQTKSNKERTSGGCIKLGFFYRTLSLGGPSLDATVHLSEEEKQLLAEQRAEREKRMKRKESRAAGRVHLRYKYRPPNEQWEGLLYITVVECAELKAKDSGGSSDPYVTIRINQQTQRTKTISKDLNPVYNTDFSFFLPPKSEAPNSIALHVSVYDRDRFSQNEIIGQKEIILTEEDLMTPHDEWVVICSPPSNPKKMSKKLGSDMAEQGWAPKLPLVLVPGFGSSSLEVKEGFQKWMGTRVWLSIGKLGSEKMRTVFSSADADAPYPSEWESEKRNRWVLHMALDPKDGVSDPAGVKLRPVKGTAALTYLDPGPVTSNLSYVMGPLVENLQSLGYVDGENLMTAPYDWRVAPQFLEERDHFYSNLKERITHMVERNNSPVVVLGHSMGNRTLDYFFRFVQAMPDGQQWLDTHIYSWVAVGAPFLGAPKAFRGLVSGDALGLEAFITQLEALRFARGISTTAFLFPIGLQHYFDESLNSLAFTLDSDKKLQPMPFEELLVRAGSQNAVDWFKNYFGGNPLFGGSTPEEWTVLKPPPIKRLHAIYGVNLDTEKFYVYGPGKNVPYDIEEGFNGTVPNHKVKNGYGYETAETKQKIIHELTGHEGCRSGDGTVPYASLAYCERWRKDLQVTVEELEGAEHRKILNNRLFFKKLIEHIGEKKDHLSLGNLPSCLSTLIDDVNDL